MAVQMDEIDRIMSAIDRLEQTRPAPSTRPTAKTARPAQPAHSGAVDLARVFELADSVPLPEGRALAYGTAGFRDRADRLESTCLRMGMLAVLRAARSAGAVGIMVTASHNPPEDNGMKLADPSGGMLDGAWEPYCTELANSPHPVETLLRIAQAEGIITALRGLTPCGGLVVLGWDTRESSDRLKQLCVAGIEAVGGKVCEIGVVTTPQLHHVVYSHGRGEAAWASVDGYYHKLAEGFFQVLGDTPTHKAGPLHIDCANGVGALHVGQIAELTGLDLLPFNASPLEDPAALNVGCGAEFAQKKRLAPANAPCVARAASFDGDADRIVYFSNEPDFVLFDGDKIAVLIADFLSEQVQLAGLADKVQLGIVQTAYANGAAYDYVTSKGIAYVPPERGAHIVF